MSYGRRSITMLWMAKSRSYTSSKLRRVSARLQRVPCVRIFIILFSHSGGDIKIYRKEGLHSFELAAEANDPNPLKVEYISFGSYQTNRVQFYFNCSFSFATPDSVATAIDHPLLAKEDVPPFVDLRNCKMNFLYGSHLSGFNLFIPRLPRTVLVTKCNFYSISDNDYKKFIKISDIRNSQPDGYIVRIVLYILGPRDAHVLLTTNDHPNYERDYVYEFGE